MSEDDPIELEIDGETFLLLGKHRVVKSYGLGDAQRLARAVLRTPAAAVVAERIAGPLDRTWEDVVKVLTTSLFHGSQYVVRLPHRARKLDEPEVVNLFDLVGPLSPEAPLSPERPIPPTPAPTPAPSPEPSPEPHSSVTFVSFEVVDEQGRHPEAGGFRARVGPEHREGVVADGSEMFEDVDSSAPASVDLYELGLPAVVDPAVQPERPTPVPPMPAPSPEPRSSEAGSVCVRLVGMMFALNKTFVLPGALEGIRLLRYMYDKEPEAEILVVGHTDTTGAAARNLSLSLQRAQSVLAFLKDDVDAWYRNYAAQTDLSRRWGEAEDIAMLAALPRGAPAYHGEHQEDPSYASAVARYQEANGLTVDGDAGYTTRTALIADYMAMDETSLPSGTSVIAHGCGQHFPAVPTEDGVEELENRRVEVFFFREGIAPPVSTETSKPGDTAPQAWLASVVEERSFRPGAGGLGELLLYTDIELEYATQAEIRFQLRSTDGAYERTLTPHEHGESDEGYVRLRFDELPKGSYYSLALIDHEGQEQLLFEDVAFARLNEVGNDHGEALVDPFTLEEVM